MNISMETAHHRLPKCLFLRVIKANGRKDWSAIAVRYFKK